MRNVLYLIKEKKHTLGTVHTLEQVQEIRKTHPNIESVVILVDEKENVKATEKQLARRIAIH